MVDVQVRGPGGISARGTYKGTYGFGPIGIDYNLGLSGGSKGIEFQGLVSILGFGFKASYSTGNRHPALSFCLSMISAQTRSAFVARENRYPPIGS
jgi:hypothetical protein